MSISMDDIRLVLDGYLTLAPDERPSLDLAYSLIHDGADLTSRREFRGHATAGAVVLNPNDRVLHVHHRALDRWLLPGGHLERADSSLQAGALRELAEETGIDVASVTPLGARPLHVDVHFIPANPVKGEPGHPHIDFRFAFRTRADVQELQVDEVIGAAWREISSLDPTLQRRVVGLLRSEGLRAGRAEAAVGAAASCDPPV